MRSAMHHPLATTYNLGEPAAPRGRCIALRIHAPYRDLPPGERVGSRLDVSCSVLRVSLDASPSACIVESRFPFGEVGARRRGGDSVNNDFGHLAIIRRDSANAQSIAVDQDMRDD